MTSTPPSIRIGADVGGTFTDVVWLDGAGQVRTQKVLSTPPDFEQAVLHAVRRLIEQTGAAGAHVTEVAHGTTVATNAVLEHRGARTALITTRGFRDVLEIRRIRAPQMYDLFWEKPRPLVERYLRLELTERMSAAGEVVTPLAEDELEGLAARLEREGVESVAVCLLHAYAFPQHEQIVGAFLKRRLPGVHVSLSHEILRERREYERTATTVVNAYVRPVMQRYLSALRDGLDGQAVRGPLLIMQSAGGLTPAGDAAIRPVYVLESGPAAGVLAAHAALKQLGLANAITLDVGGTTAKASIIEEGRLAYSAEYEVGASLSSGNRLVGGGGELIRAPSIDIAEVGAGGGSLAYLDRAGGLRVGPQSAGASPGPVCYGRGGTTPTVTDANVVLGYIQPGALANGDITINLELARRAVYDHIARPLGLSLLQAAEGVHRIANARMMRALRAVSTERGRDPRDFVLVAFGGAGPIHAAGLATELLVPQVVVPPLPGLFSALGLLVSGVEHHDVRSCRLSGPDLTDAALDALQSEMRDQMLAQFAAEGFAPAHVALQTWVDARFAGQASEIRLPLSDDRRLTSAQPPAPGPVGQGLGVGTDDGLPTTVAHLTHQFLLEHERLYGHRSDPGAVVEVVAVRLVGHAATGHPSLSISNLQSPISSLSSRPAYFGAAWGQIDTPVVDRASLRERQVGPLLIDEYDTTVVVPPDVAVHCDAHGRLILEPRHADR